LLFHFLMNSNTKIKELTLLALETSFKAGKKILEIYDRTFDIDYKSDGSPLTEADKASHDIIMQHLKNTGLPVLSEEGKEIPFEERKQWKNYWLVDPLDGTKEFIKRNGEFTVNIALMENHKPLSGVIHQPTKGIAFAGIVGKGLYKFSTSDKLFLDEKNKIKNVGNIVENKVRVIASRSHKSVETEQFIEGLKLSTKNIELINAGSSLKFCLLAEGIADVYPRFAPTMEWDTAAGHALLKSVGKNIYLHPAGTEMVYNNPVLINEWFIAR
jgi:3'(2'), 5'-bisphosphate nucleotidase